MKEQKPKGVWVTKHLTLGIQPQNTRGLQIAGIVTFIGIVAVNAMGFIDHDTRSGLGCGTNWPLCHGSIIPSFANEAVIIEYVHRLLSVAFVAALAVFLISAYKRRHQSAIFNRLTLALIGLLVTETVICTAGVLWNVPAAIMAWLAPIGLFAQGILLIMLRRTGQNPDADHKTGVNRPYRILSLLGILTLVYLYFGAWLSYVSSVVPILSAIYLVSGILLALSAILWIVSQARTGKGKKYGLWPMVFAPFVPSFESGTVAGDLIIYIWLSWCSGVVIYYLFGRVGRNIETIRTWQRPAISSKPHQ